jgi:hypothetical protein
VSRKGAAGSICLVLGAVVLGCGAGAVAKGLRWTAAPHGPRTAGAGGNAGAGAAFDQDIAARFEAARVENQDLAAPELAHRLGLARAPDATLSFDPTAIRYWKQIRDSLELTSEEQALYRRTGVVGVDHVQRYSMASAYLAIYRRDLPVLITTDSILHALHRSFDTLLMELESNHFYQSLSGLLDKAHQALGQLSPADLAVGSAVRRSVEDVDLYLTVARNLLTESEGERGGMRAFFDCLHKSGDNPCPDPTTGGLTGELAVKSKLNQDAAVKAVLGAIAALKASKEPPLYGRKDVTIDWSQFAPRGHYTKTPLLRRYFRTLMWLGRIDVGFSLAPPAQAFGRYDADRELAAAGVLAWLVRQTGQLGPLDAMDHAIGFLVGASDNAGAGALAAAAERAGVRRVLDFGDAGKREALRGELRKAGIGGQRIRSQVGARAPGSGETPLPEVMQLFGQRFAIDSFVLSKVVFDAIQFQGRAMERTMPSGMDVIAALGNDEAVALLEPELQKWGYAANLLAVRRIVEERPPAAWNGTLYDIWLSALGKLDDVAAANVELPEVMRGRAWQRKQLQTQLASWAELRHDTILYVKQSYTMGILCEYPTGYVEPYPEFYARLALFAEEARRRLGALKLVGPDTPAGTFFTEFGTTMHKLESLAGKELAGTPFTREERAWVKEAISAKTKPSNGCGGPPIVIYSGWYPKLIYGSKAEVWEPVIADVHSDPNSGSVLEVGTGDAGFVVVAVNNERDRGAYVGPVFSYYEFTSQQRLTDEAWRARFDAGKVPPHPEWTRPFQATPKKRNLVPPKYPDR